MIGLGHACAICGRASELRYCPEHRGTGNTRDGRPTPEDRGYGHHSTFAHNRNTLLADKPQCALGCGRPATIAHHDPPRRRLVASGVANPDDLIWLRPVCHTCHNGLTAGTRSVR